MEGLVQANAVITRSNSAGMAQLAHMTVTIHVMQEYLKTLLLATMNPTGTKRNFYGATGEILLMGVKSAQTIKQATRKMHITICNWLEAKTCGNDG